MSDDMYVTDRVNVEGLRRAARLRASRDGRETTIHFHQFRPEAAPEWCSKHEHETIGPDDADD